MVKVHVMKRERVLLLVGPLVLAGTSALGTQALGPLAFATTPTTPGEWRFYSGDNGSSKYSALDQINKTNVGQHRRG